MKVEEEVAALKRISNFRSKPIRRYIDLLIAMRANPRLNYNEWFSYNDSRIQAVSPESDFEAMLAYLTDIAPHSKTCFDIWTCDIVAQDKFGLPTYAARARVTSVGPKLI